MERYIGHGAQRPFACPERACSRRVAKVFKLQSYFEALVSPAVFPTLMAALDMAGEDSSSAMKKLQVGDALRC